MFSFFKDMWPWVRRPHAFNQGDLNGLCGPVSVVNAIKLISPRLIDDGDYRRLHSICVKALGDRGGRAISEGTNFAQLKRMVRAAIEYTSSDSWPGPAITRMQYALFRNVRRIDHFGRVLDVCLADDVAAAIIGMNYPSPHWTVVSRCDRRGFVVFEAGSNSKRIRFREATLGKRKTNDHLYHLVADETILLRRLENNIARTGSWHRRWSPTRLLSRKQFGRIPTPAAN